MHRLVLALADLARQPVDEAAVLERDARMVGERLEQARVLGVERAGITEAIADGERADDTVGAVQRGDDAVADTQPFEVFLVLLELRRPGHEHDLVFVDHPRSHPLARKELGRNRRLERHVALRAQREHRPVGIGRLERQLGDIGTKELAGLFEDRLEHRLRALRATDGLREVVEQLEVRVALPERCVRPIGHREHHRERTDEHARGEGLANEQRGREREARVAQRSDGAGDEHQAHPRTGSVPAHREGDRARRNRAGTGHRDDRGEPRSGLDDRRAAEQQAEDDDRDRRLGCREREVEGQLHEPLAIAQHERDRAAEQVRGDQTAGTHVEETDDERDVVEGEAVGLALHLEVERERLGDRERDREAPPCEPRLFADRAEMGNDGGENGERRRREDGTQEEGSLVGSDSGRARRNDVAVRAALVPSRCHMRSPAKTWSPVSTVVSARLGGRFSPVSTQLVTLGIRDFPSSHSGW